MPTIFNYRSYLVLNRATRQIKDSLDDRLHQNTIGAEGDFTRIVAVPVTAFDDLLDRDFVRRRLERESRQLQRFSRSL